MNNKKRYLVSYNDNWADEFDISGYRVITVEDEYLVDLSPMVSILNRVLRMFLQNCTEDTFLTDLISVFNKRIIETPLSVKCQELISSNSKEEDILEYLIPYLYDEFYDEFSDILDEHLSSIIFYFGTNEDIEYNSVDSFLSCLEITEILEEDFEVVSKYLNKIDTGIIPF